MKLRIALWACTGSVVVFLWTLYIVAFHAPPTGIGWALISLTCPIALAHHQAISLPVVLLTNAVTYALMGAFVESVRGHSSARLIAH